MPRRDQLVARLERQAIFDQITAPTLIHNRTTLNIHSPSSTAGVCECCGSPYAKVSEKRPDLDLLIDLEANDRFLRTQIDHGLFDELAAAADLSIDSPLRCSEIGLRLVLSDRQTVTGQGASRSSKTQHGVVRSYRVWMLRGGPGTEMLFCGPEVRHAHILMKKWCVGEGPENPAVCDPRLILSYPKTLRDLDQSIRMIDGTVIHLTHLKGDGGNIAGISPVGIQITELAKVKNPSNWGQLRTRVISSRGSIYLDAVPEAGHFVKRSIIDPALQEEEDEQRALERGDDPPERTHELVKLHADDNPWNPPGSGAKAQKALEALDPRIAARYAGGEWVGDRNRTFAEFLDPVRHSFDYEGWDLAHLGFVDVTRAASLLHFPRPVDWIISADINGWPHSALPGKIGVRPEVAKGIPKARYGQIERKHWVAVFFDFIQVWGVDSEQAAQHLATVHGGLFAGAGVVIDGTSAYRKHNAGGVLNSRKKIVPAQAYKAAGFAVRPPDKTPKGKPGNPDRQDSAIVGRRLLRSGGPTLPDEPTRVLINAVRCANFWAALRDQESEPDGITPDRRSSTSYDMRIVSGTDCFRYWTYPFFRLDKPAKAERDVRSYA